MLKTLLSSICILTIVFCSTPLLGEVKSTIINYTHNGTALEGVLYQPNENGPHPGLLMIHQWTGISDYEHMRANTLAEMGYVVFIADIYGKGIRPPAGKESALESSKYKKNRLLMRQRVNAGLAILRKQKSVNPQKIAAIGYCFGGTVALELMRSGATINGIVSFHGGLESTEPYTKIDPATQVLVFHGAIDPHVPWETVTRFKSEMEEHAIEWQLTMYGKAVHAFSQKHAGNDPSKGAAYNEIADKRSFSEMLAFFNELFID